MIIFGIGIKIRSISSLVIVLTFISLTWGFHLNSRASRVSTAQKAHTMRSYGPSAGYIAQKSNSNKILTDSVPLSGFRSGILRWWRRLRGAKTERNDSELKSGIAKFYDESSAIWLDVWGEHMHHGYYPLPHKSGNVDHQAAQVDMIDRSLEWAYGEGERNPQPKSMVDVGCGVGGSSRYIAKKYPSISKARGISLSPYQIERATQFTKEQHLEKVASYSVDDAMNSKFTNNEFDLTWSMESGEHMPDKKKFFGELFRITAPGGRIIIVTWCHRELVDGEIGLTDKETRLLNRINDAYYLPDWVPASHYRDLAMDLGLEDVRVADWSPYIAPFWPAVFFSALVPRNFFRMVRTGITTIKGAIATLDAARLPEGSCEVCLNHRPQAYSIRSVIPNLEVS